MIEAEVVINHPTGLHARPAALLVAEAKKFNSKIIVKCAGKEADARSIMGIMTLGVKTEATIALCADGPDENEAVARLKGLIETNFAEGLG
ncbi:MAG TPA: HPr family phosphocarrier protein [bacterium]|nr:HPr family phosphocarrier protein [bacterium]